MPTEARVIRLALPESVFERLNHSDLLLKVVLIEVIFVDRFNITVTCKQIHQFSRAIEPWWMTRVTWARTLIPTAHVSVALVVTTVVAHVAGVARVVRPVVCFVLARVHVRVNAPRPSDEPSVSRFD